MLIRAESVTIILMTYNPEQGDHNDQPLDPSTFDVKASLASTQINEADFDVQYDTMIAKTIVVESEVLSALETVGFPVELIRRQQAQVVPNQALFETIKRLDTLREITRVSGDDQQIKAMDILIEHTAAIASVASLKVMSDIADVEQLPSAKQEQQLDIYTNNSLLPEDKALFLKAIEILYPNTEGLDPLSSSTAKSIEEYDEDEKIRIDIGRESYFLREPAKISFRNALLEQGLGQHEKLEDVASKMTVALTLMHVVKTGNYKGNVSSTSDLASQAMLRYAVREAQEMGWTQDQTKAVVKHIQDSLEEMQLSSLNLE